MRTKPEWMAFGVSHTDSEKDGYVVYLSTDVDHIDMEPNEEEIMTMGSSVPVAHHISSIDIKGSIRSFEYAFSEMSTAAAAATVGLTELLGSLDAGLRPHLEMLYYASVDHIETAEQAEAFEALAEYLGV